MAEQSGPSPDRNNPRPLPLEGPTEDRVHRVADPERPAGGPFGPGKKKRAPFPAQKPFGKGKPFAPKRPFGAGRPDGDRRPPDGDRRPFAGRRDFSERPPFRGPRDDGDRRPRFGADAPPDRFAKVGPGINRPAGPTKSHAKPPAKLPTDWTAAAEWYDSLVGDEGSEYHREVVLPGAVRLLGEVAGKRVLDVACGQGVLSRMLHSRGAQVSGVDASEGLIAAARERNAALEAGETPQPEYSVADATSLAGVPEGAFDLAACILAIQNIQPLQPVFTEVSRRLKPGGAFVVVMMHPAFRSPKATFWGWDAGDGSGGGTSGSGGVQFRRVDKYLSVRKEPIVTHPGKKTGEYTWSFHRPIGEYINAARKAGLLTDAMEEWPSHKVSDSGPRAAAENLSRKEIPMFLALRMTKPL